MHKDGTAKKRFSFPRGGVGTRQAERLARIRGRKGEMARQDDAEKTDRLAVPTSPIGQREPVSYRSALSQRRTLLG